MREVPRSPGFSSTSTRRSASAALMMAPDSMTGPRTSSQRQSAGRQVLAGSGVISPAMTSQSGARFRAPICS